MSSPYRVRQGDCLSSIAFEHGFADWNRIYFHPSNEDFRALRPNPNILNPGDTLMIPDKESKEIACPTDRSHRFTRRSPSAFLRLEIVDFDGQPLAGKDYKLEFGSAAIQGTLDSQGWLEHRIPPNLTAARLTVWDDSQPFGDLCFELQLGALDPATEISGVQGRLINQGIPSPKNGILDEATADAIAEFQHLKGLSVSRTIDDATRIALVRESERG